MSPRYLLTQSGSQVIFPTDAVRGVRTHPVRGEFTSREALDRRVAQTGHTVAHDEETGAVTVTRLRPNRPVP